MKKFIIASVAIISAAFVQAATVDWTSGDLSSAVLNKADITGITAYYYVLSGDSATAAAQLFASDNYTTEDLRTFFNDDGSLKTGVSGTAMSGSPVEVNMASTPKQANITQDNVTDDEYVLAVYIANSRFGGSYALASIAYVDVDEDSAIGYNPFTSYVGGMGEDAFAAEGGWTAVPEPTSVALLALGLAAVGLKRKVA